MAKWISGFEFSRTSSGLKEVNILIYSMGDEADDILHSFGLSEDDQKDYKWSKRDLMVTPIKEAMLFTKELDLIAEPRARRAS